MALYSFRMAIYNLIIPYYIGLYTPNYMLIISTHLRINLIETLYNLIFTGEALWPTAPVPPRGHRGLVYSKFETRGLEIHIHTSYLIDALYLPYICFIQILKIKMPGAPRRPRGPCETPFF